MWITFQWDGMDGPGATRISSRARRKRFAGSRVGHSQKAYELDPPAATGDKVVIVDTDHVNPGSLDRWSGCGSVLLAGLRPIFMDDPPSPWQRQAPELADSVPDGPTRRPERRWGIHLLTRGGDLAGMTPTDDAKMCSTRYCLRNPGVEYLVFRRTATSRSFCDRLRRLGRSSGSIRVRVRSCRKRGPATMGEGKRLSCTVRRLGSAVSQGSASTSCTANRNADRASGTASWPSPDRWRPWQGKRGS